MEKREPTLIVTQTSTHKHTLAETECNDRADICNMYMSDARPSLWHVYDPSNDHFMYRCTAPFPI